MSGEIISFKVLLSGNRAEEYYSLDAFERALREYPVAGVRVYRGDRPIFMSNMTPRDEGHVKWVLMQVKKILGIGGEGEGGEG